MSGDPSKIIFSDQSIMSASDSEDNVNTIIHPEDIPVDVVEDELIETASVTSTSSISASKQLRKCPCCEKEIQTRSLFNHVYKMHPDGFLCSMAVYKENEMEAYLKDANAYPFEYTMMNDFDETEEFKIYGCLACKHTFTDAIKANAHCQTKKCKAGHIKGIKAMIKAEKESKKKPAKSNQRKTIPEMKRTVELEMRRYKHLCVVSQDLQDLYTNLKEKQDNQTQFDDTKLFPITQFAGVDYRVDTDGGYEGLERQLRLWGRRNCDMETHYVDLRDYLYHYSSTGYIDRYKAYSYDFPDRIFVGTSSHEALGDTKYPPL
jgi:hypothetical protein